MTVKHNRLIILLLAILLLSTFSLAASVRKVNFSNSGNSVTLSNNSDYGFELQFKVQDYSLEEIQTKAGTFEQLSIEGFGYSGRIGQPKLPVFSKLIAVPVGAELQIEYLNKKQLSFSRTDAQLRNRIIPAQPSVSKSENPDFIPFELNSSAYSRSSFGDKDIFTVEEVGYLRGARMFRFDYEPVQYNPQTGELQILSEATIKVNFINPDLIATQDLLDRTGSVEYDAMYGKLFYNWRDSQRVNNNRYPTKILILCPPNYTDEMQSFVDWKKQQGYTVVVTTVGTGGTVANTTAAINTYMASVWSAATVANPAPSYLLIVGDTSTTGDNIIANTGTSGGTHPTDLTYVRLNGTDYLPEMYYGRFSVSTATELTNIITKTLTFQKTLMPDLSYLGKAVMIAGVDATYGPINGNGQINYGTTNYFNATNGITTNTYLYPASGSSDASIIANANEGRGYINYTAHGSETSWADPTFTVSNVNAMTNTNKYGVMVGNCCVTNAFNTSVCFGESIIRKANAGGVAYIGATNNSYWSEDYWWGIGYKTPIQAAAHAYSATTLGAYDAMFHTHGEAFTNWATTVGEINVMGNTAVEQSSSTMKPYYWEIYSIMGDPTTMPYMGVPTVNTATYPSTILVGATSITVTATPYSRVALTMGGTTYGTALVPAGGSLSLPITPFSTVGTAKLVITAQNKITRIIDITIAPNSGAYMTVDANTYNDANNNVAEYNETGRFTTTFKNVGSIASGTITATLTCATAGISITDGTESIAAVAAGASVVKTNAFSFTVANNIVNQLSAAFTITMVSGSSTWVHNFSQVFNAPALAFGNIVISDPAPGNNNGRLDPGETVTITMPLANSGGAASQTGSATLSCATSGITVNTGTANFTAISASGSTNLSFSLTAASGMTVGTVASLVFNATAGAYTANKTEATAVGLILEDFETGNLNAFPWVSGGTLPWTVVNSGAYAGTYAAKSGAITHSQSSTLETTRVLTASGTLTFWYKVSSESGYDYLKFYVDGVIQNGSGWAGEVAWTQATYALAAGTRELKWEYMKDSSADNGSDCAWIDNIVFPASTAPSSFYPPQNFAATPGNGLVNLSWQAPLTGTPTGYKIFKNSSLLTTITGLSYSDTAVTNGTSYSYYLKAAYSGGDSDATNTVTATPTDVVTTVAIIGTETTVTSVTSPAPINIYYKSRHGQSIYTAAELSAAGVIGPINITQLGFYVSGAPATAMPNFIVRMKHTTATNVATAETATGMVTVYSNASYLPVAGGYQMLTLSTPFLWNGTSNLVIDTAFGLLAAYNQSGTVQYTTVPSGYMYWQSDNVDQTNVFTAGSSSTSRPNVKFVFAPITSGPQIAVTPATLAYGDVAVNTGSTRSFTINNTGGQLLTGSITTPTGYTVALQSRETRNVLSFSIASGSSKTYNLTLTPTAATAYNGNVVISSNSTTQATYNLAVTGAGFVPATIAVDANQLTASLVSGEESTETFTISNTGSLPLTYSIGLAEVRNRGMIIPLRSKQTKDDKSIAGSTLTVSVEEYTPGTTEDWTFTVSNASTDTEWLKDIYITFPAGVTVNSAANFIGGDGGDMTPDITSGTGVTIHWHGETSNGYGVVYGNGDTATAVVNVTVGASISTDIGVDYEINGDVWGAEPHIVTGTITLPAGIPPVLWFSASPSSGTIAAGANQTITGSFSSVSMGEGLYEALLSISSDDPVHPLETVQILMEVTVGNHVPVISLPESFSFDKNSSLVQSFSSYISDTDLDPLSLSVSGNSNVIVDISGSSVTFTATQNWCGSEVITFTVSDGTLQAHDAVTITVNPTDTPSWEPVVYPNNPATVYAKVTIDGIPAQLNDVVAAFVGTECRGTGEIVMIDRLNAYATIVVNLASSGETVGFKIYSYAADTIYPVEESMPMATGASYGTTVPVPLDGTLAVVLQAPSVQMLSTINGIQISWNAVQHANNYKVYYCSEPYGTFTLAGSTPNTYWNIASPAGMMFYKVVAEQTNPAKGTK